MLWLEVAKGWMGTVSVIYIIVRKDDANKMDGCPLLVRFLPEFALLLSYFRMNQRKMPEIVFLYVL